MIAINDIIFCAILYSLCTILVVVSIIIIIRKAIK